MAQEVSQNKTYLAKIGIKLKKKCGFRNITRFVNESLRKSGIQDGFVSVNAMDTKASVFINDDESGLHQDFAEFLDDKVPSNKQYKSANAAAHIKRQLFGRGVMVAVSGGSLDFGPWNRYFMVNLMVVLINK
eukprot:277569_1